MKTPVWSNAIKSCADPQRAKHFFHLLAATSAGTALQACSAEQARVLSALFSGSQALCNLLVARPDWLRALEAETLKFPRRQQGLRNEVSRWLEPLLAASDFGTALMRLREFKQREMLRIAARDLARLGKLSEIMQEISDTADVCLDVVWQVCYRQLARRYGQPWHHDTAGHWQPTAGCVLGMGKLGGQELN
jgi:glutamate-ammonia-ligase adenylyltransferase